MSVAPANDPSIAVNASGSAALMALAARFALAGPPTAAAPLGRGRINQTYRVEAGGQRYVLQRINRSVFPEPQRIMDNRARLDTWLQCHPNDAPRLPRIIPTRDGAACLVDAASETWRMQEYLAATRSLERLETPEQAHGVGVLLGDFHRFTAMLPCADFTSPLPGLHDTGAYLAHLRTLTTTARARTAEIADCLDFIDTHAALPDGIAQAERAGRIQRQITHGDPKLDNILFDHQGQRAHALIDLDTVQPGLILHDLGDCLRSCCNHHREGPAKARFDLAICAAVLRGYTKAAAELLGAADCALIYDAIRLLPFELGLRFLTDHLEDDRYFRVTRHGDNLERARVQFSLVADIERQEAALIELIELIEACPVHGSGLQKPKAETKGRA